LLESRHPVTIVTKSALILRDRALLAAMAEQRLVHVFVSVTTLDDGLKRTLEPRTAGPAARLRVLRELNAEGVPVGVLASPMIPGLNEHELEPILQAASEAGARTAACCACRWRWRRCFATGCRRTIPSGRTKS
jgi:DNA repair photolyase